jgi:hypothetical protein
MAAHYEKQVIPESNEELSEPYTKVISIVSEN